MTSLTAALQQPPSNPAEGNVRYETIRAAIQAMRGDTLKNRMALQGELSQDDAWGLVSFAEVAAERCVQIGDQSLAYDAIYAVGLIPEALIDRRDIMVTVSVLKVGVNELGRDLMSILDDCRDPERLIDNATLSWVGPLPASLPSNYKMGVEGSEFELRPIPQNYDPSDLIHFFEEGKGET